MDEERHGNEDGRHYGSAEEDDILNLGRERFDPHASLRRLSEYIGQLTIELENAIRLGQEEAERAKMEHLEFVERNEKALLEIQRLSAETAGLEKKLANSEKSGEAERKKSGNLEKQVIKLEKSLNEAQHRLAGMEESLDDLQNKNQSMQQEMERLAAEKTRLEARVEERDSALNIEKSKSNDLEKQVRKLTKSLSESQGKIALLEKKLEDAQDRHAGDVRRLSERIPHAASHELSLYQKRIEAMLLVDYKEISKIETAPMTLELGRTLRTNLRRIFSKLEHLGLDFTRESR
ncbi:MAG: hypothetical protein AB1641_11315 [Thermodesulfobacteriota bacterium]